MDSGSNDLSIGTLIQAVTNELLASQAQRLASGVPAVFEVHDLTIEVSFVVTNSAHGGGGFDLKVIKADAGVQYDKQSVQKVTLTLNAVGGKAVQQDDGAFVYDGGAPVRPRKAAAGSDM